jgi:hypothetical protein
MAIFIDARIPIVFTAAASAGPDDALLVEGEASVPGAATTARHGQDRPTHAARCTCCAPRGAVAEALSRLFLARARSEAPFFHRVVVVAGAETEATVRLAVEGDAFLSVRYRLSA